MAKFQYFTPIAIVISIAIFVTITVSISVYIAVNSSACKLIGFITGYGVEGNHYQHGPHP